MVAECIEWIFSFGHKRVVKNSMVAYFSTFESPHKKRAAAHTRAKDADGGRCSRYT